MITGMFTKEGKDRQRGLSREYLLECAREEAEVRAKIENRHYGIVEYPSENFFEVIPADEIDFDIRPLPIAQFAGLDSRYYRKAGMR